MVIEQLSKGKTDITINFIREVREMKTKVHDTLALSNRETYSDAL